MIYKIADNILSPLGETTAQNYEAVKAGRSVNLTKGTVPIVRSEGLTRFEAMAVKSAKCAIQEAGIDPGKDNVVLILSTTKANIEVLSQGNEDPGPAHAAKSIAEELGVVTEPIVVCNACISGVAAIILAQRLLEHRDYDYAIVCGADVLSEFTVSGFQSLKAVSEEPCRPFDMERLGLNLGEAAATMILTVDSGQWAIEAGAIRNDAFHISSPSKDGEGARLALEAIGAEAVKDSLAQINAHGTATMFNDQMESVAIERAGLNTVPVNSLKGYFGHTLGAAGILETIITMAALDDHTVLGTKGFEERGVSGKILLSSENQTTDKDRFVKMISGFGGGNAAIMASKIRNEELGVRNCDYPADGNFSLFTPLSSLKITSESVTIDGKPLELQEKGGALLTEVYKRYIGDYPKYYKMDVLCRLGFVASELLLRRCDEREDETAIILFNHSSSIQADKNYQTSIADPDNYFPSPSAFVYTLPNIVTGEIAIRHHIQGETSFYILQEKDEQMMEKMIEASFADPGTRRILCGWIDAEDDDHFEAELKTIEI
ncbi:MAG: 3-oxoacyl-ACP synthase [Prevotella sp.]|nr:3-oxoacyl-ACP synthase [Prevotella sp.]